MSLRRSCTTLVIISASFAFAGACGRSEPPVEPEAAAVDHGAHMTEHFDKAREMEAALVRGDLEGAKELGRWIAEHETAAGLPAGLESHVDEMKKAAGAVASATTTEAAAIAAARSLAACGTCHAAGQVHAAPTPPTPPQAGEGRDIHMLEHQHAVDLLLQGLVGPSDDLWMRGADAMKTAPLTDKDLPEVSPEVAKFGARVHELAQRAADATTTEARVAIYGELVGKCASCHGEYGRVVGPGAPKTE